FVFFFFQAEDGIRDLTVTGVQTCALPILMRHILVECGEGGTAMSDKEKAVDKMDVAKENAYALLAIYASVVRSTYQSGLIPLARSEERRVGKECRSGWRREQ